MCVTTMGPLGRPVQMLIDAQDPKAKRQIAAQCRRLGRALGHAADHPPWALRLLLTQGRPSHAPHGADAILHLSHDCAVQIFPADPARDPIRLRLPLTLLALRVAVDYVAGKRVGMGR